MNELKKHAQYLKLQNYSQLNKSQLKALISERNSKGTQTEYECQDCALGTMIHGMMNVIKSRRIVIDNDIDIDYDTGEVITSMVERGYIN